MIKQGKKVAFPMMARYNYAIRYLVEQGLDVTYVHQPKMTRRTIEMGSRYSPDSVCTPFKTTLGSMIEALEAGADTILMTFGLCRLGYYGELQEMILRDLGYQFEFVNLSEYNTGKKKDYIKAIKRINPKFNVAKLTAAALEVVKMAEYIDRMEEEYYKSCGFEVEKGSCKRIFQQFCDSMETANTKSEVEDAYRKAKTGFGMVELDKPAEPLRVGIIGEYYTIMDEFSNLKLEQMLADMGVEVYRWMNFSNRNIHYSGEKNMNIRIRDLCTYEMGPTSTANIWCAKDYAQRGFDGLVHVKSAGCTPETDIMPVLQNISKDYKIPILYLTYDSQTSDTGLVTRVEAFYDMLQMRKQVL
jgi:predicted nucleotide-binding protein (sugar kinase/HSP70/actin superfamily)